MEYQRTVKNWEISSGKGTQYERLGNWKRDIWKRIRYRRIVGNIKGLVKNISVDFGNTKGNRSNHR